MVSDRKRKTGLRILLLVVILVFFFASAGRIKGVNESVSSLDSVAVSGSYEAGLDLKEYVEDEKISLSGMTVDAQLIPEGITYLVSNARIESESDAMEDHPGWTGVTYSSEYLKYDEPLFLLVDITIENNTGDAYQPVWLNLEAGSWSTVRYPDLMLLENNAKDKADFIVAAGETRVFTIPYELWEPTFSKTQRTHVYALDYSLTCLDYPRKVLVHLAVGD